MRPVGQLPPHAAEGAALPADRDQAAVEIRLPWHTSIERTREIGIRLAVGATEEAARLSPSNCPYFLYCNPDPVLARVAERSLRVSPGCCRESRSASSARPSFHQ